MLAASFLAGMIIVNSVFMLLYSISQGNVRASRARPVPSVVIMNAISDLIISLMSVSTKNVIRADMRSELQCSVSNLSIEALPVCVKFIQHPGKPLLQEVHVLAPEVDRREDAPEERHAVRPESVVLVPVDRDALLAAPFPLVIFIDLHAKQMFHDVRDPGVVVALNPHHFHAALGVGEFADVTDELPLLARKSREIKVLENITEKDQTFEAGMSQQMKKIGC